MQAVVDHQYCFMDIYIGWPGSTHDARVLANSDVFKKGEAGTLFPSKQRRICGKDVPLLLLGDSAYPLLLMDDETVFRLWKTNSTTDNF